ncbi:hypothetical protein DFH28DRAFT_923622 [Melampsora americana]|nr:hypothetical protein DFH28DRAFT_923622 [Melampsora americana]
METSTSCPVIFRLLPLPRIIYGDLRSVTNQFYIFKTLHDQSTFPHTPSHGLARFYGFQKKDAIDVTYGFTPGALLFYEDVKAYDESISQAVREFNNNSKPADFLDVLTKDLLLGKFIDLRRIKGELLNPKKGDTSYNSVGNEKGLEVLKFLHLEILDLAEWVY